MKKLVTLPALALAATLTLSACSSDDDDEPREERSSQSDRNEDNDKDNDETDTDDDRSSESEDDETDDERELTDPPASNNAEGENFSFQAPENMEEASDELGSNPMLQVAYMDRTTGESINVVVTPSTFDSVSDSQVEDQVVQELETAGFTNVQIGDETEMDGEDALITTAQMDLGGRTFYSHQIFTVRDGENYVITAGAFDEDQADEYATLIADSWVWTA